MVAFLVSASLWYWSMAFLNINLKQCTWSHTNKSPLHIYNYLVHIWDWSFCIWDTRTLKIISRLWYIQDGNFVFFFVHCLIEISSFSLCLVCTYELSKSACMVETYTDFIAWNIMTWSTDMCKYCCYKIAILWIVCVCMYPVQIVSQSAPLSARACMSLVPK